MKTEIIIGYVVSVLGMLPLFAGGIMNLAKAPTSLKNLEHVGYSRDVLAFFGCATIGIGILTLLPRTSFVGVILATAWMGGAIAAHVRVKDNLVMQLVILVIPISIWIGFGLRHQAEMHSLLGF